MAALKTSIYFHDPTRLELEKRVRPEPGSKRMGWSPVVNNIIERYAAIVHNHLPSCSTEDMAFYRAALRGWRPEDLNVLQESVIARLQREKDRGGLGGNFPGATQAIQKLWGQPTAALIALIDAIECFWAVNE